MYADIMNEEDRSEFLGVQDEAWGKSSEIRQATVGRV